MNAPTGQKRLVIVGASGMVGGYALRYALDHRAVGRLTAIGRRTLGLSHPKLNEVLHRDFTDCSALALALADQDAAIFASALTPGRYRTRSFVRLLSTIRLSSRAFSTPVVPARRSRS